MQDASQSEWRAIRDAIETLQGRVRRLVIAVVLMALALFLTVAVVFGYELEFHAGEPLLRGAVAVGTAILGFAFGFFAGRRR